MTSGGLRVGTVASGSATRNVPVDMADVRVDELDTQVTSAETVRLLWIPLGVGASVVRRSGRAFEAIVATVRRRRRFDLYHSALEVSGPDHRWAIEMAPVIDQHGEMRPLWPGAECRPSSPTASKATVSDHKRPARDAVRRFRRA